MRFKLHNSITGHFNSIEFKLFEEFKSQNEYLNYLIRAMNTNMDSIVYIKQKTQEYFTAEKLKMFIFEQGFSEFVHQDEVAQRLGKLNYAEMMSNICLSTCLIHHKKTLKPELLKRNLQAHEYEQNFLGDFNVKKD